MISVLMPTYNRASFIEEAIDSVLKQTYQDFELIIVDDGSTDHTSELVENYSDPRISYHAIEHTGMLSQVRNVTLGMVRGEYIAFLDSDDIWEPDHLTHLMKAIEHNEEIGIAFSDVVEFREREVLRNGIYQNRVAHLLEGDMDLLTAILHNQFSVYYSSLLLRTDEVRKTGLFNESISVTDTNFLGRVARHCKARHTHKITARVRKHASNHSDEVRSTAVNELIMLIDELKASGHLTSSAYNQFAFKYYYQFGPQCMAHKERKLARSAFLKAISLKPASVKSLLRWCSTWVA